MTLPYPCPRPTCSLCCQPFTDQDPGHLVMSHTYLASVTSPVQDPSQSTCAVTRLAPDVILCRACCERLGYPPGGGIPGDASGTPVAPRNGEGSAGRGPPRRKRGRPAGSPTAESDFRLYQDWKAAQRATHITKSAFLRERGRPASDLAAIERGRAQEKRKRSGRK